MLRPRYPRKRLFLYLIPILIGMGGVRFSQELDEIVLRVIVLIMSVAIPVFAGGNLLARYKTSLLERVFLFAGVIMLIIGAFVSASGISDTLMAEAMVTQEIANISRLVGMFSLLLGLFVVLFSVIRTREDIEEYGGRFWHLAEHMSEGFILSTADGRITLVNKQFLEMFDLSEEEVKGKTIVDIADECNIDNVDEIMETRSKGLPSEYQVTRKVHGESRHFWFKGKPILDRYGQHTANLATVRDVTEQHRLTQRVERYAEGLQHLVQEQTKKLVHSEERFRQLLHSMNEGFLTIDAGREVRFANATICKLLDLSEKELVGSDILDFIELKSRSRLLSILAQGEELSRSESRQELNLVRKDGILVPVLLAVAYIRDPAGAELLYSLVLTSVQELKTMQHQLEQRAHELELANEELKSHGRAKDSFLSNVSHELRTPLSTIQGYVEMLSSNSLGALNDQQAHALQVMERNLVRIIGHINEIIDFSRMEIRGLELTYRLFRPHNLVQESLASVHPQALEKGVEVYARTEMEESIPAWGDRDKLGQVLGILLNNAVKFTEAGGTVEVGIDTDPEDNLYITVKDSGIGIDPAHHNRIFDKFFQVDASMTRQYEGTGIGLSIAKSIVEIHHGRIELDSEVGKGCTFTITLPHAVLKPDATFPKQLTLPSEGLCMVITETPVLRKALKEIFSHAGVEAEFNTNPYVCLREAKDKTIHCIIYHPSAPEEEWQGVLKTLREHPVVQQIPILLLTTSQHRQLINTEPMWRGVYFCTIPFTARTFLSTLEQAYNHTIQDSWKDEVAEETVIHHQPTVLIIDPDPGIQEWLEMALLHHGYHCLCAATPYEALALTKNTIPDIIFLDVNVPNAHAMEHLDIIQSAEHLSTAPLYVMTGHGETAENFLKAEGAIAKPFHSEDLIHIIESSIHTCTSSAT